MRNRWLSVAVVLVVLVGAVCLILTLPGGRRPRITAENFERIMVGMRLEEVEAILGVPPGDYTTEPVPDLEVCSTGVFKMPGRGCAWCGNDGLVQLGVDEDNVVLWTRFVEPHYGYRLQPGALGRLRRWLGL
jgi:hypothetical protein